MEVVKERNVPGKDSATNIKERESVRTAEGDIIAPEEYTDDNESEDRVNEEEVVLTGGSVNKKNFADAIIQDRYLYKQENKFGMFWRVACRYSDNVQHKKLMYNLMCKSVFMPATPILSNGGTDRGLPISCFLNEVGDSLEDIVSIWNENIWLSAKGGGIGSYWGDVRSVGENVRHRGKTAGVIPFMVVQNALTMSVSQGSLRRGSGALFLPVSHPEIEEFVNIRKPNGGDLNRKALYLHHGVVISDDFMHAVEKDLVWDLRSPVSGESLLQVKARTLWINILTTRMETGEPYLLFIDTVNEQRPEIYRKLGLKVKTSNLCNEIVLATGKDHRDKKRTAVCCLGSLNLEYFDLWPDNAVEGALRLLDNVLQDMIDNSTIETAVYSAESGRDVGLGAMGFHSYLQSKLWPFESEEAERFNKKVFAYLRDQANKVSKMLAQEKGACPDAIEAGIMERFTHKLAVAPTASISVIAGSTSPGIDPNVANAYTQKTLSGSFAVRNKFLARELEKIGRNTSDIWSSIVVNEGSVQHLDFLSPHLKEVFKTAYEINQEALIRYAADRASYICQSQSVNLFMRADVQKKVLHDIHFSAWKTKKIKGLYYARSTSVQKRDVVSGFCVLGDEDGKCESCQ